MTGTSLKTNIGLKQVQNNKQTNKQNQPFKVTPTDTFLKPLSFTKFTSVLPIVVGFCQNHHSRNRTTSVWQKPPVEPRSWGAFMWRASMCCEEIRTYLWEPFIHLSAEATDLDVDIYINTHVITAGLKYFLEWMT